MQNLLLTILLPLFPLTKATGACTGSTYSYGSSAACSSCHAGSTFISATSGCYPASAPTDTAFYLSGSEREGVSAFSTINAPSGITYTTSVFGVANGSITFDGGSYLRANGAEMPTTLPAGGDVPWTVSAWVKCAGEKISVLEWGSGSSSLSGTAPLVLNEHNGKKVKAERAQGYRPAVDPNTYKGAYVTGVSAHPSGSIFYSDDGGNSIGKISPSGVKSTILSWPVLYRGSPYSRISQPTSIDVDSSGTLYMADDFGRRIMIVSSALYVPACDSTWHHVSLSYTPTEYLLSSYIDGVLFSHRSLDGPVNLPALSSSTLNIGWDGNGGSLFAGSLSDLRIYNRTLFPFEIEALSQPSSSSFPGLYLAPHSSSPNGGTFRFTCIAGYSGPIALLSKSNFDNSFSWSNAPNCVQCAAGTWSSQGSTSCSLCPPGTFSLAGASTCSACPIGTYGSSAGLTTPSCSGTCSSCTSVGSISGASSSLPSCTSGSTFLSSATGACANCRSCAAGTGVVTLSACTVSLDAICGCAGGFSQSGASGSNLICTQCSAGTWSSQGSTSCSLCPPGTFSLSGASTCSACPIGTFGNTSGLKSNACSGTCSSCTSVGSINLPQPLPVPLSCAAGLWATLGATSCSPCPPGTFSLAGSSSCLLCPEGTYGSTAGLTTPSCSGSCSGCPPGSSFISVNILTSSILGVSASPMLIVIGLVGGNILLSTIIFGVMFYVLIHRRDKSTLIAPVPQSKEEGVPIKGNNNNKFNVENNDKQLPSNAVFTHGYRSVDRQEGPRDSQGTAASNPQFIVSDIDNNDSRETLDDETQLDPIVSSKLEARKAAQIEAYDQDKIAEREIKKAVMARKKAEDLKKAGGRSDAALKADQAANMQERIAQREAMKARVARSKADEM